VCECARDANEDSKDVGAPARIYNLGLKSNMSLRPPGGLVERVAGVPNLVALGAFSSQAPSGLVSARARTH